MKKLIALLLVCSLFSCERDAIETSTIEDQAQLTLSLGNCYLVNTNRFTQRAVTYDYHCSNYPLEDCFLNEIPRKINTEVREHYNFRKKGAISKTLMGNYSIKSPENPESEYLRFSDIMDGSIHLSPFIETTESNKVYREIMCQIIEEIDALPVLDISIQKYKVTVTHKSIDFIANQTANQTFLALNYKIERFDF